jgi:hypothetical protein
MEKDQNTIIEDQRRKAEKLKYLTSYRNDNQQVKKKLFFLLKIIKIII